MAPLPTILTDRRALSLPGLLLRLEGLALLSGALVVYAHQGLSGLALVVFLLAPDLSMAGYAFGVRVGSIAYNLAHSTMLPLAIGLAGWLTGWDLGLQIGLIWLAHIGMDRAIGYGLKYATTFKDTHLARV